MKDTTPPQHRSRLLTEDDPVRSESDFQSLINTTKKLSTLPIPLYKEEPARFWILFIFSLANIEAGAMWNCIAPIASILHDNLSLSYTQINLFTIVYYIGFLIMTFPANYLVERYGLRPALILATFLLMVGQWLRLFFTHTFYVALAG